MKNIQGAASSFGNFSAENSPSKTLRARFVLPKLPAFLVGVSLAAAAVTSARAVTLSWDALGGTGIWNTSNTNWYNGATDVPWTTNTIAGDTAVFGGTAGTTTLGAAINALGLQFTTTGYTVASPSFALSIGASGIDASTLTSGTTTISAPVTVGANQTWSIGSGATLANSGGVAIGANVLIKAGGGTFNLSGINTLSTGSLIGNAGVTNLSGSLTSSGASNVSAFSTTGIPVVNILPGTNITTGALTAGSNPVANALGAASAAGSGILNVSGGTVAFSTNLMVSGNAPSSTSYGLVNITGGTLTQSGSNRFRVGWSAGAGSVALYNQSAGSVTGSVGIALMDTTGTTAGSGGAASIYVSGGSLSTTVNAGTTPGLAIGGRLGQSEVTVGGTGTITTTSTNNVIGTVLGGAVAGTIQAGDAGRTGILNIGAFGNSGGTLQTSQVSLSPTQAPLGYLNFNGGTLKAQAANATFLTGLTRATVNAGGGTIDNNSAAITVGQNLLAPTGNGVTSISASGTGYLGVPYVQFTGGGATTPATGVATIDSNGNITGIVITNPGSGYVSTPTITLVGGGGTPGSITPTLSALTGGGMTFTGSGTTTLSGANTYTGGTTINNGTLLISGASSLPSTGTLTVNSGGTISLANGTVATTTVGGLTLATRSVVAGDWNVSGTDTLATAGAATVSGRVGITLTPSGSPASGVVIQAASGLNNATYYLANNTNYTALLSATSSQVSVSSYAAVTPLTTAYWYGGQVSGAANVMALSDGSLSNWSSAASYTSTGLIPSSSANVIFSATGATQQSAVTLGTSMTLNSITFSDPTAVTIGNDGSSLTLLSTGNAITATENATINANVSLGSNQTWTTSSGKTLTVGGVISGTNTLTLTGTGTTTLSGANTYTGTTTLTSGTLNNTGSLANTAIILNPASGTTAVMNSSGNVTRTTGTATNIGSVAGGVGVLNITGGNWSGGSSPINAGTAGHGVINVTGGTVTPGQFLVAGITTSGATGVWNISGGTVQTAGANAGTLGATAGTTGVVNLTGSGIYNSSAANTTTGLFVGESGVGVLNLAGSGAAVLGGQSGSNGLRFAVNATGSGIVNLGAVSGGGSGGAGGGTITTNIVQKGVGTSAIFNFHGGTLKSSATPNAAFFTGLTSAYVYGEGGIVDNSGQSIAIGQALLAPTGNGVNSIALGGVTTGYTPGATPLVTLTGGGGTGATAIANVDGSGNLTVTITNPGTGYTTAPTVAFTGTAGLTPTGTASTAANTGGGLTFQGAGTTTLSGANTYTGGTTLTAGTLVAGNASALGTGTVSISGGALNSSVANVNTGAIALTTGSLTINTGGVGTLTQSAAANFTMSGGILNIAISGTLTDSIVGSGGATFTITGGTLSLSGLVSPTDYANTYVVFSGYTSGSVGSLAIIGYDTVNYAATLSNAGVLSFVAVPEPHEYALAICGMLAVIVAFRRRRLQPTA